jgi:small-conductance mechanosensitive channel
MTLPSNWLDILLWLVALPGGWLLGKTIKRFIFPVLQNFTAKTESAFDDAVIAAVARVVVPFCWILGVWIAYHTSGLFPEYKAGIKTGLQIFSILIVTWACSYLVAEIFRLYMMKIGQSTPNSSIFTNILRGAVYVMGIMFIMHTLNIPIAPALTALGVGGLAIALALKDTLENLFSGLQMLATKKLRPGDFVRLSTGDEGYVEDISWRNTSIRAPSNHIIIVPNNTLANGIIKNFVLPNPKTPFSVAIGVAYNSDLQKVENITLEIAQMIQQTVTGADRKHNPSIRFTEFGEKSINFNVGLRSVDFASQGPVRHEFIKAIHERFIREMIRIPFSDDSDYPAIRDKPEE